MYKPALTVAVANLLWLSAAAHGASDYTAPRNAFGQPDFTGVWSNGTTTSFERPEHFGTQLILTEEQAAELEGRAEAYREAGNRPTDPSAGVPEDGNTSAGYNRFWTDPGTQVMRVDGKPRSSMLTTANGRVPPRKAGAPDRRASFLRTVDKNGKAIDPSDHPESRGVSERCVFFPTSAGPVMRPSLYNNNYVFVQGSDHVAITVEMIHDTRIVRLNAKHHDNGVRKWMGDSVGYYEGDTLVVETTNYHPDQLGHFFGASDALKVTERFTRVADDRLLYQFTIDDPETWAEPWSGEYEFWPSDGFYEYACHEGNIGLEGILAGARVEEREAAKAKK